MVRPLHTCLLCLVAILLPTSAVGQAFADSTVATRTPRSVVFLAERPVLAAEAPWHDPSRSSTLAIFPQRDDYAWEGLAAGIGVGLLLGLAINSAYADLEGDRGVGDHLVTMGVALAVAVPLGTLIGSAIPKSQAPNEGPP